jgi:hypothetical protein
LEPDTHIVTQHPDTSNFKASSPVIGPSNSLLLTSIKGQQDPFLPNRRRRGCPKGAKKAHLAFSLGNSWLIALASISFMHWVAIIKTQPTERIPRLPEKGLFDETNEEAIIQLENGLLI